MTKYRLLMMGEIGIYIYCGNDFEGNPENCTITGTFYVYDVNNRCYPCAGWIDFPVIVLGWWVDSVSAGINSKEHRFVLEFMEEDWRFQCAGKGDKVIMTFMDGWSKKEVAQFTTTWPALIDALFGAIHDLRSHMWSQPEEYRNCLLSLNEAYKKLKSIEKIQKY